MLIDQINTVKEKVERRRGAIEDLLMASPGSNADDSSLPIDLLEEDFLEGDAPQEEPHDHILDLLDEDGSLTDIIREYWSDIQQEVADYPLMRLYIAGLYKMASEYERLENRITTLDGANATLGTSPALTNERARVRDNTTTLTMEGWKLLNAVLESLHKVQNSINKMKSTNVGNDDPFESFRNGG
jgi:hypothetical protein